MNKKLVVRQNSSKDCASACLLSIMKYYGCECSLDELSLILKTTNEGTNAYNIINGSRTFGFDGFGIHYSYDEIINNKVNLPIICHTLKDNMYHFIVVYKVNKRNIIIMDPSSNITKVSHKYFKSIYLNTSIIIYPVKIIKSRLSSYNNNLITFIFDYVKQFKSTTIKTIILSLLVIIFNIITNYYLLLCIDYILPKYNNYYFKIITTMFLSIFVFKNMFDYLKDECLISIKNNIYSKITIDVIRKLFNLPYLYFKTKSVGEIESRINDLNYFKEIIANIIVNTCMDLLFTILSSIILLSINYKLFLIYLIEIIIYLIIVLLFKRSFDNKTENLLISEGEYKKTINESINSYESNRNIDMINYFNKKTEVKLLSYTNKAICYERSKNLESFLKNLITSIIYVISIYIGISFINKNLITLGEFILFNTIIIYFTEPLKNLIDLNHNIIFIKNIYRRINDLFMIKKDTEEYNDIDIRGNISIKNLSYKVNNKTILGNINLNIGYKDKIFIYGKSGIGKSTLLKIILKYLTDYEGYVFINNINIKDINSNIISSNFTYVSQNNYLNNDTLKNNIVYDRDVSEMEYEEIIRLCNLDNLRDSKIERNNFLIEDNGFNISGGEKQKIILARSLLKNSNFIILDEALSEISVKEEKEILSKILEKYKDKTIIYVSHKEEISCMFSKKYHLERRIIDE